jgi:hypothetical protein
MYYSYIEIEYITTSFSPARTDLAVKLLMALSTIASEQTKGTEHRESIPSLGLLGNAPQCDSLISSV